MTDKTPAQLDDALTSLDNEGFLIAETPGNVVGKIAKKNMFKGAGTDSTLIGTGSAAGLNAVSLGVASVASGEDGFAALGGVASADDTIAIGALSSATVLGCVAIGYNADATVGEDATAIGSRAKASAANASAFGSFCQATGAYSTAAGFGNIASGSYSTAIGGGCNASATGAVALGRNINNAIEDSLETGVGGFHFGDVRWMKTAGVPVDYTDGDPAATGEGTAEKGSLCTDVTNGDLYINAGTKAQPIWKLVTRAV